MQIYVVQKTRATVTYIKPNKDIQRDYRIRYTLTRALFSQNKIYAFQEFDTRQKVIRTANLDLQCSCFLKI